MAMSTCSGWTRPRTRWTSSSSSASTYEVVDRAGFEKAVRDGLVSEREAAHAEANLQELLAIVRQDKLPAWLDAVCPFGPSAARAALPVVRTPITPVVAKVTRPSW
jgi:hypothetical protein